MTPEMTEKLSKYMQTNGTYDVNAIAADVHQSDDDPLGLNATFAAYFSPDADNPGEENEMIAAAKEYNTMIENQRETVRNTEIDAVLSAENINWQDAERLNLTQPSDAEDDENRPLHIELKWQYRQRRNTLLNS